MALTDTDWQVLQWLREGRQDAEIAVRLGVNVGEARARIERIRRELGAKDRAELAASKAGSEADSVDDANWRPPASAIPGAEPLAGSGRTFSRRSVLLAGAAGVGTTAAAGAGLFALSRGGGMPKVDGTPAGRETATPAPTFTTIPHPGAAAIVRNPRDRWRRLTLPSGSEIPYTHGICFMDTTTGEMDVLSGPYAQVQSGAAYRVSDYVPQIVAVDPAHLPPGSAGALYDRKFGVEAGWDPMLLQLRFLNLNAVVFAAVRYQFTFIPEGHWIVLDSGFDVIREMDMTRFPGFGQYPMALNLEGWLLVGFTVPSDSLAPLFVRLDSGTVARGEEPAFDTPVAFLHRFDALRDGTFQAIWGPMGATDRTLDTVLFARWYSDGRLAETGTARLADILPPGTFGAPGVSGDGRYRVDMGSFADSFLGLGDHEDWLYTDLDLTDDGPVFRVLSGNLHYGWGEHRRWLADSSAFIVEAADPGYPRDDYWQWRRHRRYYLVTPDGSMEALPPIPEEFRVAPNDSSWLDQWGGPEPHPDDPDLLSFGRVLVYNRATGRWFGPANPPFPAGFDPWGHDRELPPLDMRFAWPVPGQGGSSSGTILAPMVEREPFRDQATFVVSGAGGCLNLRERPSADGAIVDCLGDGTRLHLDAPPRDASYFAGFGISRERAPSFFTEDEGDVAQMYVYVRTEPGATGWVAIQYLEWAPVGGPR
jgi:DNA-binding CsgD family transcriptional regulator